MAPSLARNFVGFAGSMLAFGFLAGCSHVENQWREDGPSFGADLRTPTEIEIRDENEPSIIRRRAWESYALMTADGRVSHFPLHFEDPFEDRGADALCPTSDEYKLRATDIVAVPWSYGRYWLNILGYPVSLVVTPPWTLMESDGELSRQALGYDHDATRADPREALPVPPGLVRTGGGK